MLLGRTQLARRIFYSFCPPHRDALILDDIAKFYPSLETAEQAFAVFDRDTNGDVSRDELEMACMEIHRERLSLTASMRDLDSAAGKLDNIFMSVYFLIAILIIVAMLDAPHAILNTKYVQNVRRSGPIAETFEFDVSYGTTFEQIEHLRAKMLAFLQAEKRDFLPSIDISIADIPYVPTSKCA